MFVAFRSFLGIIEQSCKIFSDSVVIFENTIRFCLTHETCWQVIFYVVAGSFRDENKENMRLSKYLLAIIQCLDVSLPGNLTGACFQEVHTFLGAFSDVDLIEHYKRMSSINYGKLDKISVNPTWFLFSIEIAHEAIVVGVQVQPGLHLFLCLVIETMSSFFNIVLSKSHLHPQ